MGAPVVLAIARQLGSGGAFIGQSVARRLGMKYVDREILQEACAQLGTADEAAVEAFEERPDTLWSRIARFVVAGAPDAPYVPPPPKINEGKVAEVEGRIIQEIAAREDAVIVGRGAAHILSGRPHVVRVFVHAPEPFRVAEAQRAYNLDLDDAREMVRRSDYDRARFVERLTGRSWIDATLFDLTVDKSLVSIELASEMVARAVAERRARLIAGEKNAQDTPRRA